MFPSFHRYVLLLLLVFALGLPAYPSAAAEATPQLLSESPVSQTFISPDSKHVVFIRNGDLYSVSAAGGTPARLSSPLGPGGYVDMYTVVFSPDSQRVVFRAKQQADAPLQLYSVPLSGGTPVALNAPLSSGDSVTTFYLTPNSQQVVFIVTIADRSALYRSALDGSTPPAEVVAPQGNQRLGYVGLSPNGAYVVYAIGEGEGENIQVALYSVAITGGSSVQLVAPFPVYNYRRGIAISPDSTYVIYSRKSALENPGELFAVPVAGGDSKKLGSSAYDVDSEFLVSGDSKFVVFAAYNSSTSMAELYSTPITGTGSALLIGPRVDLYGAGIPFLVTPDGQHVVYKDTYQRSPGVFERDLYSVPTAGGTPVKLDPADSDLGMKFVISPDSQRVVYRASGLNDGGLYSSPIDGTSPAVKVSAPLGGFGRLSELDVTITPDSRSVIYRGSRENTLYDLYITSIDSQTARKLNGTIAQVGDKFMNEFSVNFRVSPDGRYVVFRGAPDEYDPPYALYKASIASHTYQFFPVVTQ